MSIILHDYVSCYVDDQGLKQGEFKIWYSGGQLWHHRFYIDNKVHGECKQWYSDGRMFIHCFYVNGIYKKFGNDIPFPPYPVTEEDRTYYLLKYNLLLLPVETKC